MVQNKVLFEKRTSDLGFCIVLYLSLADRKWASKPCSVLCICYVSAANNLVGKLLLNLLSLSLHTTK